MPEKISFLHAGDLDEFLKPGRFRPRDVTPSISSEGLSGPEELTSAVTNALRRLSRQSGKWFGCYCVAVRADDGMSWSAEAARRKVASDYPEYQIISLTSTVTPGLIPIVSQMLGEKYLLREAVRHKLAKRHLSLSRALLPIIGTCVLVIGASIFEILKGGSGSSGVQGYFVATGVAVVGALVSLAINLFTDHSLSGKKEESLRRFAENLAKSEKDGHQASIDYTNFIDAIAQKLKWSDQARVVIIDNYERLDPTTRAVIEKYFRVYCENAASSEFWLVFEGQDGGAFSLASRQNARSYSHTRSRFYQQPQLGPQVLRELAASLGRGAQPAYSSVKWVCRGTPVGDSRTLTFLEEHRRDHPVQEARYGDLEFFYLVCLAASPGELSLRLNDLRSQLCQTNLDRSEVLKLILKGTNLHLTEFKLNLENMEKMFKPLLKSGLINSDYVLTLLAESSSILEERAPKLMLPNAGLVHLYWTLFWYDHSQNRASEAYLIRRLTEHLLKADVSQCPQALTKRLNEKLFEVLIYTIDSSLKTCLFKKLPDLLEHAVLFYEMKDPPERERAQYRLVRRCWDVYSVLGDERILAIILRIQDLLYEPRHEAAVASSEGGLERLFLEATVVSGDSREKLTEAFQYWARKGNEDVQSAIRNASACAGWLFASIGNRVLWIDAEETLFGDAARSLRIWPDSFDKTCQRIMSENTSSMLTDVMTLSLHLWSAALLPRISRFQLFDPFQWFDLLIKKAETALVVAVELKSKSLGPNMEAIRHGLSREVCAVALASILAARQEAVKWGGLSIGWDDKVDKIVADCRSLLSSTEHLSEDDQDPGYAKLSAQVDALLSECAVIWMLLDLDRLRDFANLRRLQFNFLCRGLEPQDLRRATPLMEFASSALASQGYTGLLANCVVANCCRGTRELLAHYSYQAAQSTLGGDFGENLRNELTLLAVHDVYGLEFDTGFLLGTLLKTNPEGKIFLRWFLGLVPVPDFPGYALELLTAAQNASDGVVVTAIEQIVAEIAALTLESAEKEEVLALIEFMTLKHQTERGFSLPAEHELLDRWANRKHVWLYSMMLRLWIEKGHPSPGTWHDAYLALDHNPGDDRANGYLLLASEIASHVAEYKPSEQQKSVLVTYLKGAIKQWEGSQAVATNMAVYRLLGRLDESNTAEYLSSVIKWGKIKIIHDHLKRLRELAEHKKYLLIFHEYYESTSDWGLSSDASPEEWRSFATADFDQRTAILKSWIAQGSIIPNPFVPDQRATVSAKFLWIGQYLFLPPNDTKIEYEEDRLRFGDIARNNLPHLVDMILKLPNMPAELRDLFAYHSKQLLEHAGPVDIKEIRAKAAVHGLPV